MQSLCNITLNIQDTICDYLTYKKPGKCATFSRKIIRGAWVAQLVQLWISAQVMISQLRETMPCVGLSPLSLPLPDLHSLSQNFFSRIQAVIIFSVHNKLSQVQQHKKMYMFIISQFPLVRSPSTGQLNPVLRVIRFLLGELSSRSSTGEESTCKLIQAVGQNSFLYMAGDPSFLLMFHRRSPLDTRGS